MRIRTLAFAVAATLAAGVPMTRAAAEDNKAVEVLAASRKTIGKKLDALKTFSLQASVQRNINSMQLNSEIEILLDLPERYLRSDVSSGMMNMSFGVGFNGDKPIRPAGAQTTPGGAMVIRMGGPGAPAPSGGEKLSPEEQEKVDKALLRSARTDLSRLTLGWFASAHPSLQAEYSYAGEAESPDGKAHVIDAKNADGFAARLFIDQTTLLPLMVTYQGPQPRVVTAGGPRAAATTEARHGGEARPLTDEDRKKARDDAEKQIQEMQKQPPVMVDYALYFDDWREVDGVKFPHRIRRATGGATNEEWTVTRVKVNPKIDPKKFEG